MALPITNFTFTTNSLIATFKDTSTGGISRVWTFQGGVPAISTDATPEVDFQVPGIYSVSLAETNTDGTTIFEMMLVFNTTPGLNLTILEMVLNQLPGGIPINPNSFNNSIQKWQLYLQPSQNISDADVFDQTKWKPIANVLIAKLIIYELILLAAQSAMSSVATNNNASGNGSTEDVLLTDYALVVDFTVPLLIESIMVGGNMVEFPNAEIDNMGGMLTLLNGISKGIWVANQNSTQAISLANRYLWASIKYHTVLDNTPITQLFNQSNQQLSTITTTSSGTGGFVVGSKGPLKAITTGPSKAEWYDNSAFWKNMFSSSASTGHGGFGNGVMDALKEEICMYARRVGVALPFCPQFKRPRIFIVGQKNQDC